MEKVKEPDEELIMFVSLAIIAALETAPAFRGREWYAHISRAAVNAVREYVNNQLEAMECKNRLPEISAAEFLRLWKSQRGKTG